MKALQSLTNLFTQCVTEPKNVQLWAEDGALKCTQSDEIDGFDIPYTVNVAMTSVDIEPHVLMMHLVNWLNRYDIDREEKGLPLPSFATQMLDKGLCDISLKIDIIEPYRMKVSPTGRWERDGVRYDCVSQFDKAAYEDDLSDFLYFTGHEGDVPCK
ncbi:phage tail protein [Vibrio sp. OPT18]|uniref:phage tail protein n=1 Tax=Vibrio sp. OPT18 TaxID=2778641 RepID=UPI00187F4602|nr:phage tail protein [Vibrio sp. OPT18]MBE8574457.1 phage tail protein [Vibrio sp. OPT18]